MKSVESAEEGPSLVGVALAISVPCAALGGWRLREMFTLGFDVQVAPGYPSWFLGFLWFLVLGPLVVGCTGTIGAIRTCRAKGGSGLVSAAGGLLIAWAVVQTWIRVLYDPDIAFGGLIWGVLHNLTLTREVNIGATAAGSAGYSAGLVLGGAIWVAMGALLILIARSTRAPMLAWSHGDKAA